MARRVQGAAALLRDARQQLEIAEAHVRDAEALAASERRRADAAERQVAALQALVETLYHEIAVLEDDTPLEPR
jgi:hypothetical protein